MKNQQLLVLEYQENFADNFTTIAYAKILEKNNNLKCCWENKTILRKKLERDMSDFNLDFNYISSKKTSDVMSRTYFLNRLFLKNKNVFNNYTKNNVLSKTRFEISDIILITDDIKYLFQFKSLDFIKNYDILDEISSGNSIGLFISNEEKLRNSDLKFIENASARLNKFIKKPKLFIFTKIKNLKINTFIEYKVIDILDWREVYYFLSKCKHHIILNTEKSYSTNFWASVVNKKEYSYTAINCRQPSNKNNRILNTWLFME